MVTNWYPTKDNPFFGSFFKEQAFALSEHFQFLVIHYQENRKVPDPVFWLQRIRNKHYSVCRDGEENNTVEYTIHAKIPMSMGIIRMLYTIYLMVRKRPIEEYKPYARYKYRLLQEIFRHRISEEFDLLYGVHAQSESELLHQISQITGKPFVVAEHAPYPWPGMVVKATEKKALEKADTFLAISNDKIRQVLLQDVRPRRIAYVGNLVNEEQFVLGSGSGGEKTFVMVAAHTFYKNYPLFIEIFNRLTQITDVPFKVKVVGYNANKGYSQNAEELEQKLMNSAFADKIQLIPAISRDEIHKVYGSADAFVMTSVQEGMPVSALEAGCCGLPIFSTMCGGVEDYVDDSIGRIFRIVDSESFAQSLKAYLEGDICFDREHIRQRIVSRFGKKAFTDNMASVFNEVIERSKTAD